MPVMSGDYSVLTAWLRYPTGMRALSLALSVFLAAAASARQADADLAAVLARAGEYVDRFETEFSNVVSEEDYEQRMMASGPGQVVPLEVHLRSDFTLVPVPGGTGWLPFRDVFEVNGRPVRDREDRLSKLFLTPSADAIRRAGAIVRDSARYNIGGTNRTINVPVLTFEVLRPAAQSRFRFTRGTPGKHDGAGVVAVAFREIARPSFIKGPDGDMPASGDLRIDGETGTVLETTLVIDTSTVRAEVTTVFRREPGFAVAVPVEMHEEYTNHGKPVVVGTATYSRFRRFGVDVTSALTP